MTDLRAPDPASVSGAGGVQGSGGGSLHVPAGVSARPGKATASRRGGLPAVVARLPTRRASVAGAAAARLPAGHVMGGARAAGGDASMTGSVALTDGTSITFRSVGTARDQEAG